METSLVDGSCGRRPITITSNSSTEQVTRIVVHHTQVETSMRILRRGQGTCQRTREGRAPEVSSALARASAAGRPWGLNRDDDGASREYSPPESPSSQTSARGPIHVPWIGRATTNRLPP